jgi:peptidoglycan/LPS O-acetylase OafA/YrhL
VLRIFPGFWVCLLVTACVFGPLVCAIQHTSVLAYFKVGSNGPLSYVTANYLLDIKQWGIAGLLSHNPYPIALDGPLWTLNNEFTCYLAVVVAGLLGILGRKKRLILFCLVSYWRCTRRLIKQTDSCCYTWCA